MKRLVILGSLAFLSLALISGCSDDKATKPTTKTTGDPNDPQFVEVQQTAAAVNALSTGMLGQVYSFAGEIASGVAGAASHGGFIGAAKIASDTPEFHDASMYWYRSYTSVDTNYVNDTTVQIQNWTYQDSLQFWHGNTPVQFPDSALVTAVKIGSRHSFYVDGDDDSLGSALAITIAGAPGELAAGGDATINGNGYFRGFFTFSADSTSCAFDINVTTGWQALAVNLDSVFNQGDCPTAGALSYTGSLGVVCTGVDDTLNSSANWNINLAFDGEGIGYAFENTTTRWAGNTTCGDFGGSAANFSRPFDQIVRSVQR